MRKTDLMTCLRRALCTSLVVGSCALSAQAETLNVYVGQGQMPFASGTASTQGGLFGDLMHELCQRIEQPCVFRSVPWRRVLSAASGDPQGVLLNLGRTPEREQSFNWLLNVVPTSYVLMSLDRPFDSLADALAAGPVAVMAGTPRAAELKALNGQGQRVVEVTDPRQAALLLKSHRAVAWYEIDLRAVYLWQQMGETEPLQFSPPLGRTDSYIAASINLSGADELRQKLNQAFAEMNRDGTWQRILGSYLGAERTRALLSGGG